MAQKEGWKWDEEKILKALNKETGVQLKVDSIVDAMGEKFSLLALVDPEEYAVARAYFVERYLKKGYSVGYVSVNSGFEKLASEFARSGKGESRPFVIDMITKTTGAQVQNGDYVSYLASPLELTECMYELESRIAQWTQGKGGKCLILLDSVSTMLIYNGREVVEKFVHNLAGKTNAAGAVLVVLSSDYTEKEPATRTLGQFFDAVRKI